MRYRQVVDGTANTIMLVCVAEQRAVVWTKPEDIALDLDAPLKGMVGSEPGWLNVAMADGNPGSIPTTAEPDLQRQLFFRDDEKRIDWQAVYVDSPPWPNGARASRNRDRHA